MMRWVTVNDDQLQRVEQAVHLLQSEFCSPAADPMWSAEYFQWNLGSFNPAGEGYFSLALVGNEVVGTISLTKKRLLIDGNKCIGAEWGDGYSSAIVRKSGRAKELSLANLDPEAYINKSIFGRLVSETRVRAEMDCVSVLYGTPNQYAHSSWIKHLGFYNLTNYSNASFSRSTARLIAKKYPQLKFLNIFFNGLEKVSLSIQRFFPGIGQVRGIAIDVIVPSEDEIDSLWFRVKPEEGFSLVRDAAYWHHRYLKHPLA